MKQIRCLIVDDEPPAIQLLEKYAGMVDQVQVVSTSQSAIKAFDLLTTTDIDLVFLDIQMPVLNGIDFIKTLKHPPAIILTTAYREYAIDGYELDVIDYLLKPIAFDRFLKAIDKYRDRHMPAETREVQTTLEADHIFININRTKYKIQLNDILYIESLKDYVRIHTTTDKYVVKSNIGTFMKQLSSERFLRIHRSYAIAISHVQSYSYSAVDMGGQQLPIGVRYRKEFVARFP